MLKNINLNKSYNGTYINYKGGIGSFTLAVIIAVFYKSRKSLALKTEKH
jgi:hypothetical protein